MNRTLVGGVAAFLSLLCVVVQHAPPAVVNWMVGDPTQTPHWVPIIETVGTTAVAYSSVADAVGLVVTMGLAVGFGRIVGRRIDVSTEYRRFAGAVTIGSTLPAILGGVVTLFGGLFALISEATVVLTLSMLLRYVVSVSLVVLVGAFAGAALAHFQAARGAQGRPTAAETTPAGHEDQRSQPTR